MLETDAREMFCPLDTRNDSDGSCLASKCMWWRYHRVQYVHHDPDNKDGECAITLIVDGLTEPLIISDTT